MAKHTCPNRFDAAGNNGGSFVSLDETGRDGVVRLRVGNHCVITVDQDISIVALAQILTNARDRGFASEVEAGMSEWGWPDGVPDLARPF